MALLLMEGFDYYGNVTDNPLEVNSSSKWSARNAISTVLVNMRTGLGACDLYSSGSYLISKVFTPSGGVVVGFAVYPTTVTGGDIIQIREGTTIHMAVGVTAGGLLTVKLNTTVLLTGTTVITAASHWYIEFKAVIHDTTGSYELKINGTTELSQSGIDTRNAGTGLWDRVYFGAMTNGDNYLDDMYICDTSGSAPHNDFLGAIKVETLFPQTDAVAAGSNAGLTPSTGTDHGALVDETAANTSDYNSGSTVGLKDTYNYPAMTLTGTVYAVQTVLYCSKSDAAARQVCAVVRSNSVDYDGANISPTTSFAYYSEMRTVNPNTSAAWTTTEIATIQAGMKVTV